MAAVDQPLAVGARRRIAMRVGHVQRHADQLGGAGDCIACAQEVGGALRDVGEMNAWDLLAIPAEVPFGGDGGLDRIHVELGGNRVERARMARSGLRVTAGDHRTAPEVQHGFVALIGYRHLEHDHAGGGAARLGPILLERHHLGDGAQSVSDVTGLLEHQPPIEQVALHPLRRVGALADGEVADQAWACERVVAGDSAAQLGVQRQA